jgi:hypothetical protein
MTKSNDNSLQKNIENILKKDEKQISFENEIIPLINQFFSTRITDPKTFASLKNEEIDKFKLLVIRNLEDHVRELIKNRSQVSKDKINKISQSDYFSLLDGNQNLKIQVVQFIKQNNQTSYSYPPTNYKF